MSSRCHSIVIAMGLFVSTADARTLRVCADPDNLPFSNRAGQGFENRIATLIAEELGAQLEYVWIAQHKSFIKNSLGAGQCDVIPGIAAGVESVGTTRPYYRSTYVFVTRGQNISSLTDPALDHLRIGVHLTGDDYAPPGYALARRGLAANLVGYSLVGEPPSKLMKAVQDGEVDVAVIWGPFAGYFASPNVHVAAVAPQMWMGVPFTYDIAMAVRQGNGELLAQLDRALQRRCTEVQAILKEFHIPLVDQEGACASSERPASYSH